MMYPKSVNFEKNPLSNQIYKVKMQEEKDGKTSTFKNFGKKTQNKLKKAFGSLFIKKSLLSSMISVQNDSSDSN